MSRVPPIKKNFAREYRDRVHSEMPRAAGGVADYFRTAEAGVKSGRAADLLDGVAAMMKIEREVALIRHSLTFLTYAAGATPRLIAEEMGRRGHPMDHQTAYRWAKQAMEYEDRTMAEIREAPKH